MAQPRNTHTYAGTQQPPWWRFVLPKIMAVVTQKERYLPENIEFNGLWTHYFFRMYEQIFFRKMGIRQEVDMLSWIEDGERKYVYKFYTVESALGHFEVAFREFLKSFKLVPVRIYIPVLQTPQGVFASPSPYLFAIAFDSGNKYTATVSGTSSTYSFTNTAGTFLAVGSISYATNPGATSMTYAGAAMTQLGSNQSGGSAYSYHFYKESPATGANNIVTTTTNSLTNGFYDHAVSYSGTATSSAVANITQQVTGDIGNGSIAVTVTTTASSWVVWFHGSTAGRSYSAGANTTVRAGASDGQTWTFDSGGVASSSPWTLNSTIASGTEVKLDTAFELKGGATDITVSGTVVSATFSLPAMTLNVGSTISPSALSATFSEPAISLSVGSTITASALSATFSQPVIDVITPDAMVTPSAQSATFSTAAPSIDLDFLVSAGVVSAVFSQPAAAIELGISISPSALSASFSTPTPSFVLESTISPSALSATFSTAAAAASGNTEVLTSAVSAVFSTLAPSIGLGSTISVSALVATFTQPTLRLAGSVWRKVSRNSTGSWTRQGRNST